MNLGRPLASFPFIALTLVASSILTSAFAQDSSSATSRSHGSPKPRSSESALDSGSVSAGVYRNSTFGFTCKIPAGWVLRTDDMNAREDNAKTDEDRTADSDRAGRVLLSAYSRPPEARAEDVNASILIAAESVTAYPGLKDAAQYFGPVTEVAKAQGFEVDEEPYAFAIGTKKVVRGDFEKDVGTRVMRQSTMVVLARGYVVSFTFIGGTEDEVEELINGLSFANGPTRK